MDTARVRVVEAASVARARDRLGLEARRQHPRLERRTLDRAVARDELEVTRRPAEQRLAARDVGEAGRQSRRRLGPAGVLGRSGVRRERVEDRRAGAQRVVDLAAQLAADREVGEDRAQHDGERDGEPGNPCDARAQAHGSRRE